MEYHNICAGGHRTRIRGPLAFVRNLMWWKCHDKCKSVDMK